MSYNFDKIHTIHTIARRMTILFIGENDKTKGDVKRLLAPVCREFIYIDRQKHPALLDSATKAHLVVVNMDAPKQETLGVIRLLKEHHHDLRIVLLNKDPDIANLINALGLNFTKCLALPINLNAFFEIIDGYMKEMLHRGYQIEFITGTRYCLERCAVISGDEEHELTPMEIRLLDYLIKNESRPTSKEELKMHIWGDEYASDTALKSIIHNIRNKIGKEAIKNMSGVGYKVLLRA